jgi:hypothetical protein
MVTASASAGDKKMSVRMKSSLAGLLFSFWVFGAGATLAAE